MTAHGYVSCRTCHSTIGGGTGLTAYGKALSRELSTFKIGLVPEAEKVVSFGAEIRAAQIQKHAGPVIVQRPILMQAEGQLQAQYGALIGELNIGAIESAPVAPRYSGFVGVGAAGLGVRAGVFLPPFGLRVQNHTLKTRAFLRKKPRLELFGASGEAEGYVSFDRDGDIWTRMVAILDTVRLGFSSSTKVQGIDAIVPLFNRVTVMGEVNSFSWYAKGDLRIIDGVHVYFQLDDGEPGVGLMWMPTRHLILETLYSKNFMWALLHLYL